LARAAIDRLEEIPETFSGQRVRGRVLTSACRWYEFRVEQSRDEEERSLFVARVVHSGRLRDFFGFNRAKHAVIEAAILASRIHLLAEPDVSRQFAKWAEIVDKTGGASEREALEILHNYVADYHGAD
jgi:hypothetical protein